MYIIIGKITQQNVVTRLSFALQFAIHDKIKPLLTFNVCCSLANFMTMTTIFLATSLAIKYTNSRISLWRTL